MEQMQHVFGGGVSRGRASSETDGTCHSQNKERPFTIVAGRWLIAERACVVKRYNDLAV